MTPANSHPLPSSLFMTDTLPSTLSTPIPENETERLAALHRYKILDTPPEAAFDRITRLAARLFEMPIALISLVDESRAWFKSCVGFGASEVPRDATFCSFAVLNDEPLIIPDTQKDARFACNPFVQSEPGVRFYAGAPLISQDGFQLGTLCLLDGQPHEPLTAKQEATLVDLAAMVVDELELRLAAQKVAQVDNALLEITQGLASVMGEAFFEALVQHFARVLNTDYVYIGVIDENSAHQLKTIATCAGGQIVDNLQYPLQDTPCWEVIRQGRVCCYPHHVQALFPQAPLLKLLSVESYAGVPFFDSNGNPLGLLSVMDGKPLEDVHLTKSLLTVFANRIATELERQQAEIDLRESEEKYRRLFESIDEGYLLADVIFDENDRPIDVFYLEANPAVQRLTGLDFVGKRLRELDPGYESQWWETYGRVVQTGIGERHQFYTEPLKGWYDFYVFKVEGAHHHRVAIIFNNTTDRKMSDQEQERFFAVASDLQVITKTDGYFQWVSPSFERMLGWTQAEMTSRPWTDFVHPDDIRPSVSEADALFSGSETFAFENRYRHKDGSYRWLLWRAQPYPEEQVFYGAAVDITVAKHLEQDRKQSEAALRESEELKDRILESSQDCIKLLALNTEISYISPGGLRLLEIDDFCSILHTRWLERWQGEDREKAQAAIAAATEGNVGQFQGYLPTVKGTPKWWDSVITPVRDAVGQVVQLVVISRDITAAKQHEAERQKAEQDLREAHVQLEAALVAGGVYTWRWNISANRIVVNSAFAGLFNVDVAIATAEGLPIEFFINSMHEEDRPHVSAKIQQAIETGEVYTAEYRVQTAAGEERWVKARGQVEYAPDGTPIAFPGALADITDRKQAEAAIHASSEQFKLLAESASNLLIVEDPKVYLATLFEKIAAHLQLEVYFNYFFQEEQQRLELHTYGGISEDLAAAARFLELGQGVCGNAVQRRCPIVVENALEATEPLALPLQSLGIRAYASHPLIVGDRVMGTLGLGTYQRDRFTPDELELMQAVAAQVAAALERSRLLTELQVRAEALTQANRIKDEFLAVLSHELRSPLNPILGWTRLLQTGKLAPARQAEALNTIERNAKLQSQLIEDLLDISRIMQGKLSLTAAPVSLAFVISSAIETVRLAAEAKNIDILPDLDSAIAPVSGDAARLQQVVWNLLTNAVKFTPAGGNVTVELRQLDQFAQIRVIDNGVGIRPSFLPHVFEYFRQEDGSTTRKFGGLGLGLAIVRQIVELHGGTVQVESPGEGLGATFTVKLPLLRSGRDGETGERGATHSLTVLSPHPLSGLRVLVIDDEMDSREFVAFVLKQAGANVTTASTATEGFLALTRSPPDVLLSDIGMPEMNGYMLMRQIRALAPALGGQIPAIALTAYASEGDQQQAQQVGFQRHMAKPIEPDLLISGITELLNVEA
ncbi:GAF domain-containing protein [Leptolyngbya sp. ST-U4]|uniref:GAF domain-containing protein n=1 Tax=Leptolyngbya sp. ST-U4 TaxID=2933912 RepID=UPI0032984637